MSSFVQQLPFVARQLNRTATWQSASTAAIVAAEQTLSNNNDSPELHLPGDTGMLQDCQRFVSTSLRVKSCAEPSSNKAHTAMRTHQVAHHSFRCIVTATRTAAAAWWSTIEAVTPFLAWSAGSLSLLLLRLGYGYPVP